MCPGAHRMDTGTSMSFSLFEDGVKRNLSKVVSALPCGAQWCDPTGNLRDGKVEVAHSVNAHLGVVLFNDSIQAVDSKVDSTDSIVGY